MDRQGENCLKILAGTKKRATIRHLVGAALCVCPHLGGHAGPPLQSGREDDENFVLKSGIYSDFSDSLLGDTTLDQSVLSISSIILKMCRHGGRHPPILLSSIGH